MGIKATVAALCMLLGMTAQYTAVSAQEMISLGTTKVEEQMAVINADRAVRTDDITVLRFRFLLSELSDAAAETPKAIGDKLIVTRKIIRRNYGKEVSLLTLAEIAFRNRFKIKPGDSSSFFALLAMSQDAN